MLLCPVFQVMVEAEDPDPARVRQLRPGTWKVPLKVPEVMPGTVVEVHGPNRLFVVTVTSWGVVVSAGLNVTDELVGGRQTRSPAWAWAGAATTSPVQTAARAVRAARTVRMTGTSLDFGPCGSEVRVEEILQLSLGQRPDLGRPDLAVLEQQKRG